MAERVLGPGASGRRVQERVAYSGCGLLSLAQVGEPTPASSPGPGLHPADTKGRCVCVVCMGVRLESVCPWEGLGDRRRWGGRAWSPWPSGGQPVLTQSSPPIHLHKPGSPEAPRSPHAASHWLRQLS